MSKFGPLAELLVDLRSVKDIEKEVQDFTRSIGIDAFSLGYVDPTKGGPIFLSNHPEIQFDEPGIYDEDPVSVLIRAADPKPFYWGEHTYKNHKRLFEIGCAHGIRSGLIVPVRPDGRKKNGRRMMISLDCDRPLDGTPQQITDRLAALNTFTLGLTGVVVALFDNRAELDIRLDNIEKDILKLIIARTPIHNIPYVLRPHRGHDVVKAKLASAAQKLGVTNAYTAAYLARQVGLIT
ncbi:autoinducer binding domain-containing protein [Chitinimonas koreensis]|uniref:autoinducer binding domain-containing protein n=1 Tax=Chitinimonas koreensis TaxID=356302 RepID=UPI000A02862C|nr:autoinducer binding domain-containing protein [Chitinimonas koreensis]QNM95456.1 autoinducer binding domain-containing protein [Chitinimonas koreensis]